MHSENLRIETQRALTSGGLLDFGASHSPDDARARLLRQIRQQSGRAGIGRGGPANDFAATAILEAAVAHIIGLEERIEALEGAAGVDGDRAADDAGSDQPPAEPTREPREIAVEDLEGVGPALAEALAAYGYTTLEELGAAGDDELLEVKGISENKLDQIRGQLAEIRAGVA